MDELEPVAPEAPAPEAPAPESVLAEAEDAVVALENEVNTLFEVFHVDFSIPPHLRTK